MEKRKNVRSARETMGVFTSAQAAEQALQHVAALFSGDNTRVALIEPHDPHVESKLKDEFSYMGQAAIAVHLWSVVLSVGAGVVFWWALYTMGMPIFVHEAPTALLGSVCVFLLIGILAGCFVAYKPSRNGVIEPTKKAVAEGKWVLVAYPNSGSEINATKAFFDQLRLN